MDSAVVGYRSLLPRVPILLHPDCLKLQISYHAPLEQIDRVLRKAPPNLTLIGIFRKVSSWGLNGDNHKKLYGRSDYQPESAHGHHRRANQPYRTEENGGRP